MEDYLIVDGYNVLNNWNILKQVRKENFAHARDKLVELVANYAGFYGVKAIVVFDAHQVKGGLEKSELTGEITVIYSKEGETADMVIEKITGEFSLKGVVCVVTSDRTEQQIILGKGAVRLSAREFWHRIEEYQGKISQRDKESPVSRRVIDQLVEEQVRAKMEKWRRNK